MKTKSRKLTSTLLAFTLVLSLFTLVPTAAQAEENIILVTEHPIGATYFLNDAAVPISTTFEQTPSGIIHVDWQTPAIVRWYWSFENNNTDRTNGFAETEIAVGRGLIEHTTTHIPATDTVGVKYYYAVFTYGETHIITSGYADIIPKETVSNPARIEVIAPEDSELEEPGEQSFIVNKTDEDGVPLPGAFIRLEGLTMDGIPRVHNVTTDIDGRAMFTVEYGTYTLSEYAAPSGYNATDESHELVVTSDGVFVRVTPGRLDKYSGITFINKEIPPLNKKEHFAYMQGYPDGTFKPGNNMTRAEAVVMFSRLLEKTMDLDTDYRGAYYPDVLHTTPWAGANTQPWYANQVCYMYWKGVLASYSRDGRFRPNEPVTRAEFATLASHFEDLELSNINVFTDVPDNHWAVRFINSAAAKGWIVGYSDGTFAPDANITRAEVVTLVNRILERKADEAYLAANAAILPRSYSDIGSHWAYLGIMEASMGHDYDKDGSGNEKWIEVYP